MAEVTEILCPICHKPNLRRARFCQHCGHDVILNNDQPTDHRRYVITRIIKRGGQGAVYEGIDQDGNIYAIKEMLDRFADPKERAEAVERFNAEAELLQQLRHPRIPRVYSHFTDEGRHYLTMDFIRGEDLEQIIEREGRIDEQRVLRWADEICDVLSYLHGKGLIYRDMKPSNVMIEPSGDVKLIDFGIAKVFKPTERGTQIGTPGYAPPEQYQGLATPQSDIYALAATLHHLLTGRDPTQEMPFSFPPARALVPEISERTSAALEKALQKVAKDRFATMDEFRAALIPRRQSQPAQVRVAPASQPVPVPARPASSAPVASVPVHLPPPMPVPPPSTPMAASLPSQPAHRLLGQMMVVIVLLGLIAMTVFSGYVLVTRPTWAEPFLAPIVGGRSQPAPLTGQLQTIEYELEVTVAEGTDEQGVLTAFREAYRARVQREYGTHAQINPSIPISYVGQPRQIRQSNGQVTYQARLTGRVWVAGP
ncbi:serine/threonine-protein kinase [uncultured Chloroflexus sp.]|uniref:serine/threonine protein kinase n=1 Tax=uncultured Chloroflexus sp. TaxID=214040 RepID=UPI00263356B8|nr:serine/threonine-protein kinase [uncultured Chloroflexus sp.]